MRKIYFLLVALVAMTCSLHAQNYLTFTAEEAGATIQFDGPSCEYRLSGQETWTHNDGAVITLAKIGDQVQFRCELDEPMTKYSSSDINYYHFTIPKKVAASGNIMSLMDKTCSKVSLEGAAFAFYDLFKDCTGLMSAPELPATELASSCYSIMFSGCTGLTSAPELPATTLDGACYSFMFSGCTGLTSAPELPATTLAGSCYRDMFYGCTGLVINTSGPGKEWSIPANVVTETAWNNTMFEGTSGNFTGDPEPGVVYYIASDPTGINSSIEDINHAAAVTYNLNGQQVGADAKGLLIQNGRKMIKR